MEEIDFAVETSAMQHPNQGYITSLLLFNIKAFIIILLFEDHAWRVFDFWLAFYRFS